jgi:[ribosomal protein S5]-alanine N-acetyltransferase
MWVRNFTDEQGFNAWFEGAVCGPNVGIVARHADSGGVVGVITISAIVMGLFRSAFLGYYGMVDLAGRGLMTEALKLSCDYAFKEIGLHRVEANIQPANDKSVALVRRVGFVKEGFSRRYLRIDGEWRDHERWALLSE